MSHVLPSSGQIERPGYAASSRHLSGSPQMMPRTTRQRSETRDDNREEFGVEPICTVLRSAGVSVAEHLMGESGQSRHADRQGSLTKHRSRRSLTGELPAGGQCSCGHGCVVRSRICRR